MAACQGCRSVSENSPSPAGICSPAKRRLAACLPLPGFLGPSGASGGLPSLCPYETQGGLRMPGRSFSQARATPLETKSVFLDEVQVNEAQQGELSQRRGL